MTTTPKKLNSIKTIVLEAGSPAPDFEACRVDGKTVRLSDYWRERPVVVVFMRYLGCTFCRTHVAALRDHYAEFQAAGAEVVCVAMGSEKVGQAFKILFALPYPLLMLGETNTKPYQQYGLIQGNFLQLFGPKMFAHGFAALLSLGNKTVDIRQPGDKLQMPGTFIIDPKGMVRLAYRSKDAADNPPVQLLLSALERMQDVSA